MASAVHFGAGNIGRGFIGLLLSQAGYEVVFSDVDDALVDELREADEYTVVEAGSEGRRLSVSGFDAVNSRDDPDRLVREIAAADVVTTAVGPNVLRFVAPAIAEGIRIRPADAAPLAVMACENAVGATDILRAEIEPLAPEGTEGRAVFANTAVDRIVPAQDRRGLDVLVEPYCEWVIDRTPFRGAEPSIPGARFVDGLAPYIERKLFTVNTGHATTAYTGRLAGHASIASALRDPAVRSAVEAVLAETSRYLVAQHGIEESAQADYARTIVRRFENPAIDDPVARVGRQPIRKLSRGERFVAPALGLAEQGRDPVALLAAMGAALRFDDPGDEEAVRLQALRRELAPARLVADVMGLGPADPLYESAVALVAASPA